MLTVSVVKSGFASAASQVTRVTLLVEAIVDVGVVVTGSVAVEGIFVVGGIVTGEVGGG